MWCSCIHNPFRKILEENPRILSKNGYIIMCGKLYENDKVHAHRTNYYIYCCVCDSLVFIPATIYSAHCYHDSHLKRCISGNTISNEHERRKEILQFIDRREFRIWQYKQYILQEEAKINCLELFFQSTSHSEKDKLVLVSYDHDANIMASYKNYAQSKATVEKNTMPNASNFKLACISVTSGNQKMVSPNSYQSSNYKSDTGKLFISSQYAKQPKGTMLRLRDGKVLTVV
ncbi:hypothetical protein C1646_728854 [Rhizophagus diaphanus]|nr:hypothetical protein C1646_728854 [Rhizophagus diaphanus] [Rhizophagus sp. MUCL 43196]